MPCEDCKHDGVGSSKIFGIIAVEGNYFLEIKLFVRVINVYFAALVDLLLHRV